jgi:hypothetical protein
MQAEPKNKVGRGGERAQGVLGGPAGTPRAGQGGAKRG